MSIEWKNISQSEKEHNPVSGLMAEAVPKEDSSVGAGLIPARKHCRLVLPYARLVAWIPAFAGMTKGAQE